MINEINKIIEMLKTTDINDIEYEAYGIRGHEEKDMVEIGQDVQNSYEWYADDCDEDKKYKELNYTSTISITKNSDSSEILKLISNYAWGRKLIIVGGDDWGEGQDEGERQIKNAVRVA